VLGDTAAGIDVVAALVLNVVALRLEKLQTLAR
jgi:hypothetical protein